MRGRMDDHLIQEPRVRRIIRRQPPHPVPAPRREEQPRVPAPHGPPREEHVPD
jgi:hypothetical protein